ncbi:MAG: GIY-YIG nuclease family protein [Rhodobacteraceae bacterium]|nr:MAG: GIY-YIG nuclease family protein [Paracoccaceae bacterium]
MSEQRGRSVRLYLAEGSSTGILTAEIVNWTGHMLAAPRTRLEAALKREELKKTGVYILYSDTFGGDLPSVYVGEGDEIASRLRSHSRDDSKDFWDRFVAITSKDMNLTKAHVKYLEARLIKILLEAKKCSLMNRTEPIFERLPEADISDMESFLDELQLILPVVGVDFLRRPKLNVLEKREEDAQVFFSVQNSGKGISARATEVDGEFVVLAGSTGNLNEAPSFHERIKIIRDQAMESGRIHRNDAEHFTVLEDVAFSSPSAAAVFLFGTSRNGRTDWLLEGKNITYGSWKDMQLEFPS